MAPSDISRLEPDRLGVERQRNTVTPPRFTAVQNTVLIAGVVFVIAVWIAGGLAFVDSFRIPPPSKPAPPAAERPAPAVTDQSPPPAAEKSASVANKSTAVANPAEPASPAAIAIENPPKPPESQPPTLSAVTPPVANAPPQGGESSGLRQADRSPSVIDNEVPVDPAARELITRGWTLYSLPYTLVRWQEARRNFEQALELDSRSSEARIGLAAILSTKLADGWSPVLQEDLPQAEHLLSEALDKGSVSNQAAVHFTLGVLRQIQVRLPEAQSEFETAISFDPKRARTYLHLGETFLYLGQPEAGIPPLEQAIRLGPDDPNLATTYWALGTCQLLLGRVDQAIESLETSRAANVRLWMPYFYLAGAYGLQGNLEKARSALAESMRLRPAIKSLARMRVENLWLGNPQYWALQERTLNPGLRRAGLPDQ